MTDGAGRGEGQAAHQAGPLGGQPAAPGQPRQGLTIWLTGLPCSGKSTIATALAKRLEGQGYPVEILDGDELRLRLSRGLGFSKADRDEHIRRVSYVAKLLTRVGAVAVVAAISPYRSVRDEARAEIGRFLEVHVDCPVEECIRRDVKGLYQKALRGDIPSFTGVSDPYEAPLHPEALVETNRETLEESTAKIQRALVSFGFPPLEDPGALSPEEEVEILAKLKDLGYVE